MIKIDRSLQLDTPAFVNAGDNRCKWYKYYPFQTEPSFYVSNCMTEACQTHGMDSSAPCSRSNADDWYVTIGNVEAATYLEYTNRDIWKSYVWKGDSKIMNYISGTSSWREQSRSGTANNYCYLYENGGEIGWDDYSDAACVRPSQIKDLAFTDEVGSTPGQCDLCHPNGVAGCIGFPQNQLYYFQWPNSVKSCDVATGITAPCLANRKSWSAPVCAFIAGSETIDAFGSCITLHWLILKKVTPEYSTTFYFKFPDILKSKMHMKVFSDSSCKNYKTKQTSEFQNDFDENPAVQISFNDNSGLQCGVCAAGHGTDGSNNFYEKAGVHGCRLCQKPAEYESYQLGSICSRSYKECRLCGEHSWHDGTNCVPCPINKPKRSNGNPIDVDCTTCNIQTEWFHTGSRTCQQIPTRELVIGDDNPHGYEYFHSNQNDLTDVGYSFVMQGYYLDKSSGMRLQLPCSTYCSSIPFTFAHNCGTQGTTVYAQNKVTKAIDPWSETQTIAGIDPNNYKIEQAGKCEPCQECSIGNYNDGCGVNNEDGTCKLCLKKDSCLDSQYLSHPDDEGCNQTRARSNYECNDCQAWEVDPDDTVWLWVGCGRKPTITTWTFTGTISEQLGTCAYKSQDSSGDISQCEYRGKTITQRYEMQKFWGPYSMRIPYCPKDYFVELARLRAEKQDTEEYDPEYCTLCQSPRVDQRIDESQYRECDGSSSIDTQALGIVNSCEANRYEDEISGSCKMCETCSGGRL